MKGETQILNLSEKLKSGGIAHKLWIEQPENFPTCLATKPYPKSIVSSYFKKLKLCKWLIIDLIIHTPLIHHITSLARQPNFGSPRTVFVLPPSVWLLHKNLNECVLGGRLYRVYRRKVHECDDVWWKECLSLKVFTICISIEKIN